MTRAARLLLALAAALGVAACAGPREGALVDATPRIAVVSAFAPELALLAARVQQPRTARLNGVDFTTGTLEGKPVVLFLSGISMTNAAMTTQLAIDRFRVSHVVFSGIAGGVDPSLSVGDVAVPGRWAQYLEVVMARETAPGRFEPPSWMKDATLPAFGMLFPRPVGVRRAAAAAEEKRLWFDVDPAMLAAARRIEAAGLERCKGERCLSHAPRLLVGGQGVSGQAFVDNKAFREYAYATFAAQVLDMETAAVGMVAYSNGVPWIAFRSLSDLAGGGEGENEIPLFFEIAADNSARVLLAFLRTWNP